MNIMINVNQVEYEMFKELLRKDSKYKKRLAGELLNKIIEDYRKMR